MQPTNHRVWDYAGDNYFCRLVSSKTDGKIVQCEHEGDTWQEEKIDALQLEEEVDIGNLIISRLLRPGGDDLTPASLTAVLQLHLGHCPLVHLISKAQYSEPHEELSQYRPAAPKTWQTQGRRGGSPG